MQRQNTTPNNSTQRLTQADIIRIGQNPEQYPQNDSRAVQIYRSLLINPEDMYLQTLFLEIHEQYTVSQETSSDPFFINCPSSNQLPSQNSIIAGKLRNDVIFPFPLNRASCGALITGLPGSTKTTLVMFLTLQLIYSSILVIAWDLKATWRRLLQFTKHLGKIIVISVHDILWCLLQPPPNTSSHEWANRFTKIIAQVYQRISAQRMLREVIEELLQYFHNKIRPTPRMILDQLNKLQAKNLRDKEYVSSLKWVFADLLNHFPDNFDVLCSDFPNQLFSTPGRLIIVEDTGLPTQHWNFLISLSDEWLITYRRNNPQFRTFDVIQILEDATSLVDPAIDSSTPGGVSLIALNMNISREMRSSKMIISHSIQEVSSKILHSVENYFLCSLRGDNLYLAQQLTGLTREQAEFMRVNPRGTCCAFIPSVWPKPVLIQFPNLWENSNAE